jgi:type I restriction enzyme S subunit
MIPLGEVAEFINGAAFKPEDWHENGRKIIRIQNLNDSSKTYNLTTRNIDKKYEVNTGDILVSWSASLGVFEWLERETALLNQHIFKVIPDKSKVNKNYLKYSLDKALNDMECHLHGATMKHVNRKEFLETKIYLPPLEEQRRIAAILDKADGVRRKHKEAIRLTEELLKSTFLEMFGDPVTNPKGWEVKRLGEICTNFQNGIGKNSEHYGHGSKVANISDLYEWHRFIPEKYSLLDVTPKEIEKYSLMRGDLLFVRSSVKREGVAVCSVYDSDEICLFSSFMIRVRPRTDLINPEFLSLMLRTPPMRNRLILGSNTSTITNISQPGLSKIEVVVPPIKTQNLITKVTKNIEESVRCHLQALEQSENLFNSLLQRAFRGEL